MPQETNLNISPYFDDYDPKKNFYKVLFKPGVPVQARELTGLQSILQNQIEQFGNHVFKEGSIVIPGQINYNNQFFAVEVEPSYAGISLEQYAEDLVGKTITGDTSRVKAKILKVADPSFSERSLYTLYISYQGAGIDNQSTFSDGEILLLDDVLAKGQFAIQAGEGFANTAKQNATSIGSAVILAEGVYFLRGTFVNVEPQTLILDAHSNFPSYKVGFDIIEEVITSDEDDTLYDNAKGFTNYAASGADRFKITAVLSKKPLDSSDNQNFVSLLEIREGILISGKKKESTYNILQDELARRTSEESGDYYVTPFTVSAKESLNNNLGNSGIFNSSQLTYNNNVPSESLGVYKISPGKAYIKGYEVETLSTTFIDFQKPRTVKTIQNDAIRYLTGSTYSLNRVYGAPSINMSSPFTVSLRDARVGTSQTNPSIVGISQTIAPGKEIGLARVYDFALESGSYNSAFPQLNQWDIALFDVQTYTEITINEPVGVTTTFRTPKYIKGKSSGATGFLRYDINNSKLLTLYNTSGTFSKGEKLIIDGLEVDSRIAIAVTAYTNKDVKALSQVSTSSTIFTADIIPDVQQFVGDVGISSAVAGVSTVTVVARDDIIFLNIAKPGNLVTYTIPGSTEQTISRITSVSEKTLTVIGITTVSNFCNGALPTSNITVNDFILLTSNYLPSVDNTLYTTLPRPFISSVDLSNAQLTIRKEFPVSINSNQTNTVFAGDNETFTEFDEERYVLTRSNGAFEVLSSDKFVYTNGSKELTIVGLGTTDANARLIATLNKVNVKNKVKTKQRINSVVIDRSRNSASGIGSTTLNDGLAYSTSYPYGTRIQDEEICMLYPDVTKIYAVLETDTTIDPILSTFTLANISGSNSTTADLVIGEELIGEVSKAVAVVVSRINDEIIEFSYLNEKTFQTGETLRFKESGVTATGIAVVNGSKNILNNYSFDYGQKDTIYDFARLIRNPNAPEPKGKLRIIFETAVFDPSDDGDLVTANSYDQYDYCTVTFAKDNINNTDIIDARLRVKKYDLSNTTRSPFEFLARTFDQTSNCSRNVLASDETFIASYSYYLPRIDKIYLTKEGVFQVNSGIPAEFPEEPPSVEGSIEVATISIPPYLCDASKVSITLTDHKRYQMRDIAKLEDRIKNLEKFTTLNALETTTENLKIKDGNGLDRFKSGFFVDNFSNTQSQNKTTIVKNSIDNKNAELRPAPYTTQIDLLLGSKSLIGIGSTVNPLVDTQYATDLIGNNIRRTGQLVTLEYEDVVKVENPFATRVENVTPFLVTTYTGTIELFPSSDTWVDQVRAEAKQVQIDNFTQTQQQLIAQGWDPQTGYSPVTWGAWETTWTGETTTSTVIGRRYYGWWGGWGWWGRRYYSPYYYGWYGYPYYYNYWGHYYGWWGAGYPYYYWGYPWYGYWGYGGVAVTTQTTTTKTGTATREGTQLKLSEQINTYSQGDSIISSDVVPFMRSRNIEFIGKRFKPFTQVYGFFDGEDVNSFITPKLIEIAMNNGVFQVGETVIGTIPSSTINNNPTPGVTNIQIQFRVAKSNHRTGPFNEPTDVFLVNPYNKTSETLIPENYSTTSTTLNVDIRSLAEQVQGDYYGHISKGMILRGQTSKAEARVTDVRLITDSVGTVIGSFFIPNPNVPTNPTFETGTKAFRLTSSKENSQIVGVTETSGEENYEARGTLNTIQETIVSVRSAKIESEKLTETKQVSESSTTTSTSYRGGYYGWPYYWRYRYGRFGWCRWDPLAQSFFVEEENGIFVTKVELFFRTKDAKLPVILQLRPMQLGLPQSDVHPFSEIVVEPKDIQVSEDASVPTTIRFPSPVYLKGGTEHALVLMSESNDYNVWISRLGEIDVTSKNLPESQQIVVTQQPLLGSLFKSQNGTTWDPSQYEDLKFTLFKANFTKTTGDINFYNPDLSVGNKQIANLITNPLEFSTRRIRVGLGSTVVDNNFQFGNTVIQIGSNATGNYVSRAGVSTGTLNITNNGTGYTPGYYSNVPLVNITGNGKNGTANISIGSSGEVVSLGATIQNGGTGYRIGDIVTVASLGGSSLGRNIRFSITNISGFNEIILDQVQGNYKTGVGNTIRFVASGIGSTDLNSTLGGNVTITSITPDFEYSDGLHVKVYHKNHGMHSKASEVNITGCLSEIEPTNLLTSYDQGSTDDISLSDMRINPDTGLSAFATFENVGVSTQNPGYIMIDREILSYTGISGNTLTGITREIDQTNAFTYAAGSAVMKYELSGVSLRRINKIHNLQDSNMSRSIDLDYYYIKLDMSSAGKTDPLPFGQVDRSGSGVYPALYTNQSKTAGGSNIFATQNIPFEIIRPVIQTMDLSKTELKAKIRTITGSSVDGKEAIYADKGYEDITLDSNTYLTSPRMIASKLNENKYLSTLPGSKSFTLNLTLNTSDNNLSPVIDLDRVAMIFTSNRINNPISDYKADFRTSSLETDPSAFVYATNTIGLEVPASAIKIIVSAHVNTFSDIRAFYAIMDDSSETPIYYPFPGYRNKIKSGQVINIEDSDGTADTNVPKSESSGFLSNELSFRDYEFTIDNLPNFKYYTIKLVGTCTNQAYPPRLKSLRVLALA